MPDSVTLAEPENHSFHCLLDVPRCSESGYVILTDKDPNTGMHCIGARLDDTQALLSAGFANLLRVRMMDTVQAVAIQTPTLLRMDFR